MRNIIKLLEFFFPKEILYVFFAFGLVFSAGPLIDPVEVILHNEKLLPKMVSQ
jgi:hypothetical protein